MNARAAAFWILLAIVAANIATVALLGWRGLLPIWWRWI